MSAYNAVTKITKGHDCVVPVTVSTIVGLLDNQFTPSQKEVLLAQIIKYLNEHPEVLPYRELNSNPSAGGMR